jgi:hypothetical protein
MAATFASKVLSPSLFDRNSSARSCMASRSAAENPAKDFFFGLLLVFFFIIFSST